MNKRKKYNLTKTEGFQIYEQTLKANIDLYEKVRIRSVLFNYNGTLRNALTLIIPFSSSDDESKRRSLDYNDVKLIEEWKTMEEYGEFIEMFKSNTLIIDGQKVSIEGDSTINQYEFLQSNNNYSPYPGYLYETNRITESSILPRDNVLIDYNLPLYSNIHSAIMEWCSISNYHGDNDARNGSIIFYLPLQRVFFKKVARVKDHVNIEVFRNFKGNVRLKGSWINGLNNKPFERNVQEDQLSIEFDNEADSVHLYLASDSNDIFDFYFETLKWHSDKRSVLVDYSEDTAKENYALESISKGECESVEFKPFIKLDNKKLNEVIEAVIAMANTDGGVLFISVNDYGETKDIQKDVYNYLKDESGSLEDKIDKYARRLCQKVVSQISNHSRIDYNIIKIEGNTIIFLNIDKGNKLCHRTSNNDIFIRRGSTNMRPSPKEIVELSN